MFLSLTLHERNLLSLDFLENISKAATTLFLEQKETKIVKVPCEVAKQQQQQQQQQQQREEVSPPAGWAYFLVFQ